MTLICAKFVADLANISYKPQNEVSGPRVLAYPVELSASQ